ncbi:16S rRNA (guanine(1207)-N(2))-methyltransferase RsmC [Psychrobium sp. MM17-31]|uniref:16S rRNA (guanine(1207)-N(2))-methyltransferase RsmC n=1 Tax=Psychrobium sp. MM17-31 TaxID=2917758 RepID=UPI001EF57F72|nr:16S rRNA (guanine(1207)-N(2))-methyltransferase RsmC [Psychrobium sp. MM17-31]MCG7531285.1 16S rRNA (guanine(1207)-N(2))-methyltransferase RsmC [Psychrobium sp. MM17-31]
MSTLANPSQVIARNFELFEHQRVIVAGFLDDNLPQQLCEHGAREVLAWGLDFHNHKVVSRFSQPDNLTLQFAPYFTNPSEEKWQQVILYWPKAKERAIYFLANVLPHLSDNAEIYLVGDNKGGVKSAAKQVKDYCDKPVKVDSARHCALFRANYNNTAPDFTKEDWIKRYQVSAEDETINIVSLPGVFSHGELDLGTQLLLQNLGHIKMKRTLDFGCGCGIIGTFIGLKRPQIPLELIDIDALAIESATMTLAANNVEGKVYPSDGLADLHGKFATIVSNPPFHTGLKTDYKVPEQFISGAPNHLMDGGQLRIVANNFLKYEPFMATHFAKHEQVISDNKFKILSAKT